MRFKIVDDQDIKHNAIYNFSFTWCGTLWQEGGTAGGQAGVTDFCGAIVYTQYHQTQEENTHYSDILNICTICLPHMLHPPGAARVQEETGLVGASEGGSGAACCSGPAWQLPDLVSTPIFEFASPRNSI